ncbi:MAG: GNAT family N-acetyltransferase [Gemmataceae bacterium]
MSVLLTTPRLTLRRFTEADAQLLFDLDRDPDVTRYTEPGHVTLDEYAAKIRGQFRTYYAAHPARGFFAAIETATGEFVGWFVLRPTPDYRHAADAGFTDPSEVELGYRLRQPFWGQGLATEGGRALVDLVFAEPAVTAVVACAIEANRASTRVMEKLGLTRQRTFPVPGFDSPGVVYTRSRSAGLT